MRTTFRLLMLMCAATMLWRVSPAQAQNDVLQQADTAWNEKSYARALEGYQKVLAAGAVRDRDEVEFRIAVALGKTEQWDKAIAAGEALLQKTEWKARVLYWLGRLYTVVPHQGYKIGDTVYRGADYPKTDKDEKPQPIYVGEEDAQKTLELFERAKIAAQEESEKARRNRYLLPIHPLPYDEEIDLNFDLATWLPTREYDEFIAALDKKQTLDENVNINAAYDRKWHLPKKVLYLYNEIRKLDASTSKHDTALSLLAKGLFVRGYRARMDNWASRYDEKLQKNIVRSYPFEHLEAIPIWQQVINEFPHDPVADRVQILIAQTHEGQGELGKALAAYQKIVQLFPRSKWVSDARAHIQQITRREVSLDTLGAQPPGKTAKLQVNTRNLKQLYFAAYRVRLENYLTRADKLNNPDVQFTEFSENFGAIENAVKDFGAPVASWIFKTKDKGDYQGASETIDTPLKNLGAYAVVARAGNLRFARLLLISDLAILKKTDRDGAFAFIADARSGQPIEQANVVLKEVYQHSTIKTDVARGASGEQGFFDKSWCAGARFIPTASRLSHGLATATP